MSDVTVQPEQVIAVFDSGEPWADRYRIILGYPELPEGIYGIASGPSGNYPNGCFYTLTEPYEVADSPHADERRITWDELPEKVRRDIRAEIAWWADVAKREGDE